MPLEACQPHLCMSIGTRHPPIPACMVTSRAPCTFFCVWDAERTPSCGSPLASLTPWQFPTVAVLAHLPPCLGGKKGAEAEEVGKFSMWRVRGESP